LRDTEGERVTTQDGMRLVGRYRLVDQLGRGGMGTVWRAVDEVLGREVAVKEVMLPPSVDAATRDDLVARTRREARLAAQLNHPNVVTVFDVVEEDGRPWVVMELVPSRSLTQVVEAEGPMSAPRAAELGLQLLGALDAAHRAGILHRDVKPGNVFNTGPKLADFGLAKIPPVRGEEGIPGSTTPKAAIVGSPPYVAPERANFQSGDARSDIYSLGATMYHAASGVNLFDLDPHDRKAWYGAHLHQEPESLQKRVPDLPKDLVAVIHRCLAKNPNDRFRSFESLVDNLKKR
jgi:serine/threonine protein kinase